MREINKKEFIELVKEELGGTKVEAEKAVNAYHAAAKKALSTPDTKIGLQGVWSLESGMTKARTMVNHFSENKEEIEVKPKLKVKAKVSESFVTAK